MFKKSKRISQVEFKSFFRVAKRVHFPHTTLLVAPHPTLKVAVVVGKKVAKQAVRRNQLRRRVYATMRELLGKHIKTGVWIVVLKPSFNTLPRRQADEELRKSIAEVLKTA
jgi:ribonuclease P protein component